MPLHVDYRPETLDDVAGNSETVAKLDSLLHRENPPHVFMFTGPYGCGKTTLARTIPNELDIDETDIYEMNTADYRKLSDARELVRQLRFKPFSGDKRFWLLDECHKLSKDAQNCLLKALEEPPSHAFICLSTTDPQMLLSTVLDRCHVMSVKPLRKKEMKELLEDVISKEDREVPDKCLDAVIKQSGGVPRTALKILDSVIELDPDDIPDAIENMTFKEAEAIELARALIAGEGEKKLFNILEGLKDEDPESIRRTVIGYCSKVMIGEAQKQDRARAYLVISAFESPTYDMGMPAVSKATYEAFMNCNPG